MKDSIQVHCNSATIVIDKSEKSLMSCWITDVRSVLRLQQHFISPHNIQEIKIYNNSTDDVRGAGCPK